MKRTEHRLQAVLGILFATSVGVVIGCSGQDGSRGGDVGSSYDNLTTDLSVCQKSASDCLDAADGDRPRIQVCRDDLANCRDAVQAAKSEVHDALRACVQTVRSCVRNASDAGPDGIAACRESFQACVKAAIPPPPPLPPCAESLKQCLSESSDGGREARVQCFQTFHSCVEASLPPCMHGFATCIDSDGGSLWGCAEQAHECMKYRFTHDGGLPTR
jgi:hypothetical protein